ncbi:MAG: copper amine oxidase N-terminal domain-containing protein [Clostridia bacterium]|nr:copper amine oxidase N-terminal domain-containing protein [Clostridia bacterium]
MKFKKLIVILLISLLLPLFAVAEEYPYLPTNLKEQVISTFDIDITDKTQLYEKVNIYGDLDAWMIGWFNDNLKIITGITDLGDIIYYSISEFTESSPLPGKEISVQAGERFAREFLAKIMPETELKLLGYNAYEYTFAESHNSIPITGRTATVVVDKQSGEVTFYKGFGKANYNFEQLESLATPEHAFENFYNRIGFELVYNTIFDHSSRLKTVRPMYILNRSNFKAIDAQTGKIADIKMYDYNYYYADQYYDERYYFNNNIQTDEKIFTPDKVVYNIDISKVTDSPFFSLSSGYVAHLVSGKLSYYSNANGSENSYNAIQINYLPAIYSRHRENFVQMFDEGNIAWLQSHVCDTAFVFARAYIDAKTGTLLDYETVQNPDFSSSYLPRFSKSRVDRFVQTVAGGYSLRHYGTLQLGKHEQLLCYARYYGGVRIIGEGVCVVYNSFLREITDYCRVITSTDFIPTSFMKTHSEMKKFFKNELSLGLFYADKNENTKYVIYDATEPGIAFDPITGKRIDRPLSGSESIICTCSVGSEKYTLSGVPYISAPPVINSNKLFLPLDAIAPSLGYDISQQDGKTLLTRRDETITLSPNNSVCTAAGNSVELDIAPIEISGKVYISAQSMRTLFGLFINWDAEENLIYIIN